MTESTGATISSNSLIGKIIFGRYLLEHKVGQGGMAWVFRAQDLERDETVAAKILLPHIAEAPELRERFLREARIQAGLEHEHIVQLYDANEEDGISAIILEWIEGETMLDVSKRLERPLPTAELYRLIAPILDALGYAHEQQMVHRDIKLENIMIHWEGDTPIPKLADFGLAKLLDQMEDNQTKTGMIMGTLKYMAPEQVNATKTVDQRADIYSMGICLYSLATMDTPFSGSMQEMIVQILYDGVPDPRLKNPNLPDALADVIIQSVAKSAEMRFQTCAAFKAAFAAAVEEVEDSLGETLPAMSGGGGGALAPPAPKTYEPLPSGTHSAGSFDIEKPSRPPRHGRDKSTVIVGGGTSPLVWILLTCLVIGGVFGGLYFGTELFSSAPHDGGAPPPRPRGCDEGTSRACFATAQGQEGPAGAKGVGLCKAGLQFCKDGVYGPCKGAILPAKEACNDKDDDCDGKIDEDFAKKGQACEEQSGECRRAGTWRCGPKGELRCMLSQEPLPKGTRHVTLELSPPGETFRLGLRRKPQRNIKGSFCMAFPSRRARRVTLKAQGFYTCRVWIRPSKSKVTLKMRRRNRRSLEPRRSYCLR